MSNGADGHPTSLETVAIFAAYIIIAAGAAAVAAVLIVF